MHLTINNNLSSSHKKGPSLYESSKVFAKIGLLSFGGPVAQIALMHKELTAEREWLAESQFLSALSFCMFLPGPEAMQLATYAGWRLNGTKGGLIAGILFVLPGATLVMVLASIYAVFGNIPFIQAIFIGIKATVIIIVIEALLKIFKKSMRQKIHWYLAGSSFIAFFFLSISFPIIIIGAAIVGLLFFKSDGGSEDNKIPIKYVSIGSTICTILIWLFIWFVPLTIVYLVFGEDHVFSDLGIFFSKLAVVSFGGAYSVLAYMVQEVVQNYGWLNTDEMLDGLGLAETTNGPLILVNEFVGYLAAYRMGGFPPIMAGIFGAIITLWATFIPCFLWIFVGAPYVESVQHSKILQGALNGVMAAVVGVILNLSVWFSLHVFFSIVTKLQLGVFDIWSPDLSSINWLTVLLAIFSASLIFYFKIGIVRTLLFSSILSVAHHIWTGTI